MKTAQRHIFLWWKLAASKMPPVKHIQLRSRTVNNGHPFDTPHFPVVACDHLRRSSGFVSSHGHLAGHGNPQA